MEYHAVVFQYAIFVNCCNGKTYKQHCRRSGIVHEKLAFSKMASNIFTPYQVFQLKYRAKHGYISH